MTAAAAPATPGVQTVRLSYLPWQANVRRAVVGGQRTVVLACGARAGKDRLSVMLILEMALRLALERQDRRDLVPRVNVWVVAPTTKLWSQNWREFAEVVPSGLVVRRSQKDGLIQLRGGIVVAFKSSWISENLVSEGVDILLFTEASREEDGDVWEESLVPRLASPGRYGLALINGTPRVGKKHWFRVLFDRTARSGGLALNLPTTCNPLMRAAIPELRARMPERRFRSEILAEWPDDDFTPFRVADIAALAGGGDVADDVTPCIGVDIARWRDATFAVAGKGLRVVDTLRMKGQSLNAQIQRVVEFWRKHGGRMVVDSTGVGGGFFVDELRRAAPGIRVTGYDFHGRRKEDLVNALIAAVEQTAFRVADTSAGGVELMKQLELYECDLEDDGRVTYHGPDGARDDGVMALGLWWQEAQWFARRAGATCDDGLWGAGFF